VDTIFLISASYPYPLKTIYICILLSVQTLLTAIRIRGSIMVQLHHKSIYFKLAFGLLTLELEMRDEILTLESFINFVNF